MLVSSYFQIIASTEGGGDLHEEFVETEYYQRLNSIDKVHHTVGSLVDRITSLIGCSVVLV